MGKTIAFNFLGVSMRKKIKDLNGILEVYESERCNRIYKEAYQRAYQKTLDKLTELYKEYCVVNEVDIRSKLVKIYRKKSWDPDGKAIRYVGNVKCTADAILSLNRICKMEDKEENIVQVFERYRKIPIIFFPCVKGGINTTRANVLKDRIDHTLFDLKMYYTEKRQECRLLKAYAGKETEKWLDEMNSFEQIIDWWGVRGILTDDGYNVYDLEYADNRILTEYKIVYGEEWSKEYYENAKRKIEEYIKHESTKQ